MEDTSNVDPDLISKLPDEVLTHILSYIDTKSSVATSILSKRWNGLWISVPNLDFGDDTVFLPAGKEAIFVNFVDRVLSLNNVISVRKICLHVYKPDWPSAWISSIARRNAEEIDLNFCSGHMCSLPDSFYNQKHLVELKLEIFLCKIPQSVCFPSLVTVDLCYKPRRDDDSMKSLFSGSPLLRNLYLRICEWEDASTLHIFSLTLRILHLDAKYYDEEDSFTVEINAPNVIELLLVYTFGVRYDKIDVSSFVKLLLRHEMNHEMSFELLTNLSMFHKLTHLTLDIANVDRAETFPRLLYFTPNLVSFVLVSSNVLSCDWYELNEVPYCMLSCLESVKISICFTNYSEEVKMISYILKNANVLKKLFINVDPALMPENKNEFVETLLTLPRSSIACQVYCEEWMA